MNKNGWVEVPLISGLPVGVGTTAWRKDNLRVLFSPIETHTENGCQWSHASVSHHARYPTWDEILDVRYTFFSETDEVCQILPPKGEYVNLHKNCFHLWSPIGKRIIPL